MKERPILFSGEMVRAILDGRKTQTRRQLNPQPEGGIQFGAIATPHGVVNGKGDVLICKNGKPGDRLWVRETWAASRLYDFCPPRDIPTNADLYYAADGGEDWNKHARIHPSIHMPRWVSRITLEITGVRAERLQDISEEDAKAEGLKFHRLYNEWGGVEQHPDSRPSMPQWRWYESPIDAFKYLWGSINGADSWDDNPWVWAIEFKKLEQPE